MLTRGMVSSQDTLLTRYTACGLVHVTSPHAPPPCTHTAPRIKLLAAGPALGREQGASDPLGAALASEPLPSVVLGYGATSVSRLLGASSGRASRGRRPVARNSSMVGQSLGSDVGRNLDDSAGMGADEPSGVQSSQAQSQAELPSSIPSRVAGTYTP